MAKEWKRRDIVQHGEALYVIIGEPVSSLKGNYRVFALPFFLGRTDVFQVTKQTLDYDTVISIGSYTGAMPDEDLKVAQ